MRRAIEKTKKKIFEKKRRRKRGNARKDIWVFWGKK